ncbi:anion transporter chloroplastic-like [Raphidocelis subcapitata]|uniref:Anion transporter chloroplastic-like n=1 Tax=Raphidocelis subcapitata TaxID=307507 RepID=A0A2V0PF03_9CHLO|nr:anion transporter chloroplastic-like [Raphidocelis subcapitata]|eukprot:GBF95767.1 anion transporter chloroplastic-like [Raphidocelis subcapitata]
MRPAGGARGPAPRRRAARALRVASALPRAPGSPPGSPASTSKGQRPMGGGGSGSGSSSPDAARALTLSRTASRRTAPAAAPPASPRAAEAAAADAPDAAPAPAAGAASPSRVGVWWGALPSRYKVLAGGFMSFVICNMDKVNMSVAIIPMAQDFGWSPSVSGLVQSSFFWGYILCQLPGGYLTSRFGGRRTLPAGVAMWSAATAAVPLLAGTVPGLCLSRAAVGLGEAVAPSAVTDMVARIVPPRERSTAVAFVFSGLHVGSIAGLLAAPWLIASLGWPSVFFVFGAAGLLWTGWFQGLIARLADEDPDTAAALTADRLGYAPAAAAAEGEHGGGAAAGGHAAGPLAGRIPWRAFLRSRGRPSPLNWFHYVMLAWLPTYFVDTLSVDLLHAAQTALLPPLAGIAASAVAGPASDALIARGAPLPLVRKGAQSVAFLVPTACLLAAAAGNDALSPGASVALITAALGVSSFSLAGLYCTHQDISPKYASALLGLTNTAGAVPGIVGIAATGLLYDATSSWAVALFLPTAAFLVTGAVVYGLAGSNAPEDFDAPGADAPFGWEDRLRGALRPWRSGGGGEGKDE